MIIYSFFIANDQDIQYQLKDLKLDVILEKSKSV
ncbi:unnamed protein product (macronuclear) [Paramecium tetraurelia]|uniref:Uncharacterized protein n=1 Tax=Paramecium tetraurelia TaxID=5888 RepID=A0DLL9_PARTE|nr:uncharacterized protein GSPATT00039568001 [Paramecium tetraurelia]CAK83936.1 unnamed protein product [Paramecium tetraurelia]